MDRMVFFIPDLSSWLFIGIVYLAVAVYSINKESVSFTFNDQSRFVQKGLIVLIFKLSYRQTEKDEKIDMIERQESIN